MPYIKQDRRKAIDPLFDNICIKRLLDGQLPVGELNYVVTRLLLKSNPESYADYNALIGMLECCKLEFYRRAVAAYEDEKIAQNGDTF